MIELRAGGVSALIDAERGGRLACLRIGHRELLVGPPDDTDRSVRWGSFLMTPWAGRLADGRLRFRGRTWRLRQTHGRHAIHGLVWAAPWAVERAEASAAELRIGLDRDGWPFGGEVRQSYRLEPDRLSIEASVVAGDRSMPAALGWHPWFRRDAIGRHVSLRVEAAGLLQRRRMLPTGRVVPVVGRTDLRDGPVLGRRRLDDAYVGASPPAVIRGEAMEVRLSFGPACDTVVVYSPRDALCVEPQTAQPNALGLDDEAALRAGRRDLEPHEALTVGMSIAWAARES
jgi:aldose 1-epimerase